MASLSNFDVSNLNESMRYLGQTAVVKQQQEEQRRRDMTAELTRKEMLKNDQERLAMSREQFDLQKEGHVQATIEGQEGGQAIWTGTMSGLEDMMAKAQAKGKPVKILARDIGKNSFVTEMPGGVISLVTKTPEEAFVMEETARAKGGKSRSLRSNASSDEIAGWEKATDELKEALDNGDDAAVEHAREKQALWIEKIKKNRKEQGGYQIDKEEDVIDPATGQPTIDPKTGKPLKKRSQTKKIPSPAGAAATPSGGVLVRDAQGRLVPGK